MKTSITLALTGASGAIYGVNLLTELRKHYEQVYVLCSEAARLVLATELDIALPQSVEKAREVLLEYCDKQYSIENTETGQPKHLGDIQVTALNNWMSPVASGSSAPKQMIVCPCSTGTLSAIAQGASDNLIERAADVVIKEKGRLVLVPRETPLSSIHLRNMLSLSDLGCTILPASPGFYHQPQSLQDCVHFIVARILDHLSIEHDLCHRWGYRQVSD